MSNDGIVFFFVLWLPNAHFFLADFILFSGIMATSQSYQGDLKNNWQTQLDCLHLDYSHHETLHEWLRMPECDEFVGAK